LAHKLATLLPRVIYFYEIVDRHETTSNPDDEFVLLSLHDDAFGKKAVDSFLLANEETLGFLLVVGFVDVVRKQSIDLVVARGHIDVVGSVDISPVFKHPRVLDVFFGKQLDLRL
jgi:hypothetical protein